jgi:hypothetical protein
VKLRTGRRNSRNIYAQFGDEPSNDDVCIGFFVDGDLAKWLCREGNIHPAALRNLEALMITGTPEGS